MDLEAAIQARCREMISARNAKWESVSAARWREERRRGELRSSVDFSRHPLWDVAPEFDPRHVLKNSERISHGISRAISENRYVPRAPVLLQIPKDLGLTRTVCAFPIADEAVSRMLYRRLLSKNAAGLGGHSYAYRNDICGFDAVRYVHGQWRGRQRVFVAEYDLSEYFDSIDHDALRGELCGGVLHISPNELAAVDAFLSSPLPIDAANYPLDPVVRRKGIPQGTALSSFLANVAMIRMDRELELLPVGFVRFADDTLIWGDSYEAVSQAAEVFLASVERLGVAVNRVKSRGVHLVVKNGLIASEMPIATAVDFLGHSISISAIRPRRKSLDRIRSRVNQFIFENLLREPLAGRQDMSRVADGKDRDYLVLILQLRSYLCGELSPGQVHRLAATRALPAMRLTGQIARFAAVTSGEDFRDLDDWVAMQIHLAMRKRARILGPQLAGPEPPIWRVGMKGLWNPPSPTRMDLSLPSSHAMFKLVSRQVAENGFHAVGPVASIYE